MTAREEGDSAEHGSFAEEGPTAAQTRGMRAIWLDGFFAWFSEWIVLQYLLNNSLAFGASNAQIGYLSALVSLSAALAFLPGARLAEVFGHRKAIVLAASGVARVILLGLAMIPFFSEGKSVIYAVMVLGSARAFFANLGMPAWTALAGDLVPLSMRGRFFSSRNFGMGVSALIAAPLAGVMIDRIAFPHGWQSVWLLALFMAFISTAFFARIPDREIQRGIKAPPPPPAEKAGILNDRNFLNFCAITFLWNLGLYIAAPFFNVHLIRNMGGSESWVGILLAVMSLSGIVGQLFMGRLFDERGAKWMMAVTGVAISILPFGWIAATHPWHVIFINVGSGVLWAGYNLAWFNLLLYISPASKRAFYSAVNQITIYAAACAGPLIGGFLGEIYGLPLLFLISGLIRLAAAGMFIPMVKEVAGDERLAAAPQVPVVEDMEAI